MTSDSNFESAYKDDREREYYEDLLEQERREQREEHERLEKEVKSTAYFDPNELPKPENSYVCWLDVMGVRQDMLVSLHRTSNNIFKLHSSVLKAERRASYEISLYPVMDGVFVVSPIKDHIESFLAQVFETLAETVLQQSNKIYHIFAARAAIAYGPVIHGRDIPDEADLEIARVPWYRGSILLGNPMIQAIRAESQAPPFGIYIDESARSISTEDEHSFNRTWYRWFYPNQSGRSLGKLAIGIGYKLDKYFEWCENNRHMSDGYRLEDMKKHREMARQYFPEKRE